MDSQVTTFTTAAGHGDVLDQALARLPGFMSKGELAILCQLAGQSHGQIVELGSFAGLSTVALCLGAQDAAAEVITVDAFISMSKEFDVPEDTFRETLTTMGFAPQNIEAMCGLTEADLRNNLASFGFSPRIISAFSWAAAEQVDGPVTLLFHDADHERVSLEKDLAAWSPKLAPNAVVAFHDYDNVRWPDVKPVADTWAESHGLRAAEREFRLQVFRKA